MVLKVLRISLACLTVVSLLISCSTSDNTDQQADGIRSDNRDSVVVEIQGVDSTTVFELTKSQHKLGYESSSFGVFVKSIDGIINGNEHFWLYSVNDSVSDRACDKHMTKNGDIIKWHLRRMAR